MAAKLSYVYNNIKEIVDFDEFSEVRSNQH